MVLVKKKVPKLASYIVHLHLQPYFVHICQTKSQIELGGNLQEGQLIFLKYEYIDFKTFVLQDDTRCPKRKLTWAQRRVGTISRKRCNLHWWSTTRPKWLLVLIIISMKGSPRDLVAFSLSFCNFITARKVELLFFFFSWCLKWCLRWTSYYFLFGHLWCITFREKRMPAWRNGLARWTSNPKVVGSNPTVGVLSKTKIR